MKTLGTEYLMSFLHKQHITPVTTHCWRGIECVLCDFIGRELLEACVWFPQTLLNAAFPFANFILYPFSVVN